MPDLNDGIVIRGLSKAGAFAKEETDENSRLTEASVNSREGSTEKDLRAVSQGMTRDNFKVGFAYTTVAKIKKAGGRVMTAKVNGNANHCQIFGLKLTEANNLFSGVHSWDEIP